jgi:RimJ/RimL family protein N-acetyltransferase
MATKTTAVRLRPLRSDDLEALVSWRNDPYVRDNLLGYPLPVTRPMEQAWLDSALKPGDHEVHFAIERPPSRMIGLASLRAIDWIVRQSRLGIAIGDPASRGRGHGRAALAQTLAFAFREINLTRVYLEVADFNTPAIELYRTIGFVQEGTLRAHAFRHGKPCDVLVFGLLASEWYGASPSMRTARRRPSSGRVV